ncbi:MAG: hypothetical protein HZT43_00615 [Exiguobacterium profundum]|nr:MAG: hypothetical protein HZT43_00615 [Exiguobacterium profundum]
MSELEQPNEGTVLNNSIQTHQSGNWLEGYIAVLVGLLLVNAVFLVFALPAMAITLMGQALLGEAGIWLAAVIIAPAWIWLCFRFFLPTTMQIIWIDGRPALFAFHRVTVRRMIGVVTAQLSILRSDLRSFSARIRNWLNA